MLRFRGPGRNLRPDAEGGLAQPDRLHELPLRRWLLTQLRCGAGGSRWTCSPAASASSTVRVSVAGDRGLPLSVVVPVDERDVALAAAAVDVGEAALRDGNLLAAARAAARACGHDPGSGAVRRLLDAVRAGVAHEGAAAADGVRRPASRRPAARP